MSSRNRWVNRVGKRSAIVLAAASAAASFTNSLWAANNTFTFTAGGTSWSNPSAWLFGNPFPNGLDEIANFTTVDLAPIGPIQYPVSLDLSVTLGTLLFGDANTATPGGWILQAQGSSTLTMDTSTSAQPTINVGPMGNNPAVSFVDIQLPIFGTKGFIKAGNGLLRISNNNAGLTGSLNIQSGTLEIANPGNLGGTDSIIQLSSISPNATQTFAGALSLRSDTAFNFSNKTLLISGSNSNGAADVLEVNRSTSPSSTVSGVSHNIGTILMATGGGRQLNIVGSNFFGLNVGTLVLDPTNSAAILNNLAPGQLTVSNVVAGGATTASTLTFGGTNTNSTGASIVITNAITQSNVSGTLSVVYSDTHTLSVGSFVNVTGNLIVNGGGSLLVGSGKLPTGSLSVTGGTLDFSTTSQVSTVTHLTLGGRNNDKAYINSGVTGGLEVAGNLTFATSTNGLGATIDGKLNLGAGLHSVQINGIGNIPTQEVTVNAITNGTGTLVKSGSGQILLTNANNLSAAIVVNQGTISGAARASGNALTSGAVTISGGILRLVNQTASAGTGSIGSLDFNGAATNPAVLVIDSGSSNASTSLKIGEFKGRVSGTTGALTIIPRNGGLDSSEAIFAGSIAPAVGPALNHGILAPYVAAQASASNSSIDFLGTTGTAPNIRIGGGAAAYKTDNISNYTNGTAVFFANNVSSDVNTTGRSVFALKADGTLANITGASQSLTLGDGSLAGLIVNNGANVSVSNVVINAAEAIFWAGGRIVDVDGTTVLSAGGTISSNLSFASTTQGALTTSGSQTITFTGGFNLGGVSRTVTVSNGTAVFAGSINTGNLTKAGPNYLLLNGNNGAYNGALRVSQGSLQIGQGTLTSNATLGSTASITLENGNLVLNLDGQKSLGNFITNAAGGTGAVIVDSPTGVISFTNGTSNFSSLTIQSGMVQLTNHNQIPTAATLTVQNTGSFDMNGFRQTLGSLAGTISSGTGMIANGAGVLSTLTLNVNNTQSPNYSGIINPIGTGGIAMDKTGTGTQVLSGSNTYAGGTRIVAGTLQLNNGSAAGTGSIQFVGAGAALGLGTAVNAANVIQIGSSIGTVGVISGQTGTLGGAINVSGGTLAVTTVGTLSLLAPTLNPANFNGTVAFPGSGVLRIPANTNAGSTIFDLSSTTGTLLVNGTATIGLIRGGANTGGVMTGGVFAVGAMAGTSNFGGTIGAGTVTKIGNGTFIISSATAKNHVFNMNVLGGALVVGQNSTVGNANAGVTVNIGSLSNASGDLYFAGNANFGGAATVNLSQYGFWNVTQVPGGYATAGSLTVSGNGNIQGAYIHSSGTLNPGGFHRAGTITFNTLAQPAALTMSSGLVQMDFANPGAANLGGGTNDLIVVNGDVNLNPSTIYRFNYIGTGSVAAGQDYPLMYYTGAKNGWDLSSNTSTTSGQVRSAFRSSMSLKEIAPGIIAAHVDNFGGPAQVLTWTGTQSARWDLNLTANFKDVGNAGTTFFQQDTVVFDNNSISRPTVQLEPAVFLPAAVIVNNGSNAAGLIQIGGQQLNRAASAATNGTLSGSMKIVKTGTGELRLNGYNTFTGGIDLYSGTLNIANNEWAERDFDHPQSSGAGLGTIRFLGTGSLLGAATLVNTAAGNFPNDISIPTGVSANINAGGGRFYLAPISGGGTLNLFGANHTFRNSLDFFTGTINVNAPITFGQPQSIGTVVNWNFLTAQNISFVWNSDDANSDAVAFDMNLGQLSGTANISSAGAGRRNGNLHIGNTNVLSVWKGNSQDANGNAVMSLTKEGTGSLIMTGSHGFTGAVTVNGGVLELSNTGGGGNSPEPGRGQMTGTRSLIVRGGTFRLGTIGGGVLSGNAGTITTATTGLLMSVDGGGTIDVSNAYDADEVFDVTDPQNPVLVDYQAFGTAAGVTWAGNGGNVKGVIRHQSGTISPGRDSGAGSFGSLNFVDTLELRGGTVMVDIGSNTSSRDTVLSNNLDVGGGTVVVNVVGGSAATNSIYTIMSGANFAGSVTNFQGLVVKGRGATGTLVQGGPSGHEIQLKILTPGTAASITWAGANGGTWDVRGSQSWINNTNTPDFFYHGDTVTFGDQGAGSIALASNLLPAGQVIVNNSTNTWTFAGAGKISGSASLRKTGTGTLRILTFNDYTGGTTIDAGTLVIGNDNIYAANGNGGQNAPLVLANHGGQVGTGSIVNNSKLVIAGATSMAVPNSISGSGAVYFRDVGWTRLDGNNTWLGGTTISNGGIALGHSNALPTNGSVNFVGLDFSNTFAANNSAGTSVFNLAGPRIDLRGFEQTILELNAFGNGTNNVIYNSNAGTQQISTLTIGRTGAAGANGGAGWAGTIRQNRNNDTAPACLVAVTKMSDGTAGGGVAIIDVRLNGTNANPTQNNYGGRTNINAGTYDFYGLHWPSTFYNGVVTTANSFGTYTVANGAALGGSYTIKTHVIVQSGGRLSPGPSFPVAGSASTANQDFLEMTSADLYFGLYGFTNDQINVLTDNEFKPAGTSQVHLNVNSVQAGTFTLLDYSGAVIDDMLAKVQLQNSNISNGGTFTYTLLNNRDNTSLDLVVTQPIVNTTWAVDSSSTWSGGQNWTSNPTTPNAFGSTANFGSVTQSRTVTMDGPFSIGTANFTASAGFTVAGTGDTTLTFGNLTPGAKVGINVTAGSHAINVPVVWNNDGTIDISAGAQLSIGGDFGLNANGAFSGHSVTKSGAGTLLVDGIRNTFGNNGNALLSVNQGTLRLIHHASANSLNGVTKVNSLAIANGAKMDLTNNSMVLDYDSLTGAGSLLTQMRTWLNGADGRLFSSDADSTHGIGYKDNTDSSGAGNKAVGNFSGVTVDATALLLRYTYLGDTNVDGQVDLNDLYNVASNYNPTHGGAASAIWQKGDFDYNGYVDLVDLSKLITNWQAGVGNPLGSGAGSDLGPILTSLGLPNIAVPEPTTLGLVGLGLTGLLARRKRRA